MKLSELETLCAEAPRPDQYDPLVMFYRWACAARTALPEAVRLLRRCRSLLDRLDDDGGCPCCHLWEEHAPNCELAGLLREIEP